MRFRDVARVFTKLAALAALTACGDSTGPSRSPIQTLAVSGISVNATTFRSTGAFELGLVATAADGSIIVDSGVGMTVTLDSVGGKVATTYTLTRDQIRVSPATNADTWAAILLDDSGSMSGSDPSELRGNAAQLFWESLLPARSGNQVAFLDFGAGSTTGFTDTRLLQNFTSSATSLQTQLTKIGASGGTPLYESLMETATWMAANTTTQNRVILLMTDGQPNSTTNRAAAIAAAKAARITVHTVGLGDASDLSTSPFLSAVNAVREIAEQTGGVYSAATTANALAPIFQVIATASTKGELLGSFHIAPVPPSGTRIRGTVTVTSGGQNGTSSFSFLAP